jgi:hypothetical protein
MLREAGLEDVGSRPLVWVDGPGHPRRGLLADFADNLRPRLLKQELTTPEELDALTAAVRRHAEDPGTTVLSHLHVQAWGRKP